MDRGRQGRRALESEHGSLSAGCEIIRALAGDRRALTALGISAPHQAREIQKRAKLTGTGEKRSAPVFGEQAPAGSLKLSSFLEPGAETSRPTPRNRKRR